MSISTDDVRAAGNTLLEMQATAPSGPTVPADDALWLEEPVTSSIVAAVGLQVIGAPGAPLVYAEYQVYVSGALTTWVVNRSLSYAPGTSVVLSMASSGTGSWWSFTAQGIRIQAGGANGTVNLGTRSAVGFAPSAAPATSPTFVATNDGNTTFPTIDLSSLMGTWVAGNFLAPGDGIAGGSGSTWGILGFDQNASFSPDTAELNASAPALAPGTYLWGVGGPGFAPLGTWTSTDPSALGGMGSALNVTLPAPSTGGGASSNGSFCAVLGEPLPKGALLEAGVCWRADPGLTVPFLSVTTPVGTFQAEPAVPAPGPGTLASLAWSSHGGGYWAATLNGQTMSVPGSNGTVFGGTPVANANSSVAPWGSIWGGGIGALAPSEIPLPQALMVEASAGSGFTTAPYGASVNPSGGAALEGNAQNWSIAPGALLVNASGPATPAGTPLWNLTNLAPLTLSATGVPTSAGSDQPVGVSVWGNLSTGGTVSPTRLSVTSAPWVPFTLLPVGTGSWSVTMAAPAYAPNATQWVISFEVSAPDRAPASLSSTVSLAPGDLSLVAVFPSGTPVLDDATTQVEFWLNTTYATPAPVAGGALLLSSSRGGNLSQPVAVGPGVFTATFTPTLTPVAENDTLVGTASAPGFWPLSVSLPFAIVPAPLVLSVKGSNTSVAAGSNETVVVWANASTGPVTNVQFSAILLGAGASSGNLVVSTGPVRADGGVNVTLIFPEPAATEVGNLTWSAVRWGFLTSTLASPLTIRVAPLSVAFPPSVSVAMGTVSETLSFLATGANSTPVAGAKVTLSLPAGAGTLASTSATSAADGSGAFLWYPPASAGTWTVSYTASAPGRAPVQGSFSVTVEPASSSPKGFFTGTNLDVLVIGAIVALALVAFFVVGQLRWRRRAGPPRRRRRKPRARSTRTGTAASGTSPGSGPASVPSTAPAAGALPLEATPPALPVGPAVSSGPDTPPPPPPPTDNA